MCEMTTIKTAYGINQVAAHKKDCVANVIDAARSSDIISKIVLFGSTTRKDCKKQSDIDLAVFGESTRAKMLRSKQYKDFLTKIRHFNKIQSYDILYFESEKYQGIQTAIREEIDKGIVLYDKEALI